VIPQAFYQGELKVANFELARHTSPPAQSGDEVGFSPAMLIDWGMSDWMRYCFWGGVLVLIAAAESFGRDRRAARRLANKAEHPTLS